MIPSFSTGGVLTAPPGALITTGYIPGNTLAAQHLNWYLNHLTLELNNLLTLGGVVQNSAVDTQVGSAVSAVALGVSRGALAILGCIRVTTGSALTVPIGSGTVVVSLGSGSTYTVTLPDAGSSLAASFEVDVRNNNAGATNMLGSGYGSVLVKCLNVNDGLVDITNGTWQITEQGGHLRVRPVVSGAPSGYSWAVESQYGSVYRSVISSSQSQTTPTQNQWYNIGGSVGPLIGLYEVVISGVGGNGSGAKRALVTLSTANNTQSDTEMTAEFSTASGGQTTFPFYKRKKMSLAGQTIYMNMASPDGSSGTLLLLAGTGSSADGGAIIIEAQRVG